MTIKLLPCPFCSGSAVMVTERAAEDAEAAYVKCQRCNVITDVFEDAYAPVEDAAHAWNTRSRQQNGLDQPSPGNTITGKTVRGERSDLPPPIEAPDFGPFIEASRETLQRVGSAISGELEAGAPAYLWPDGFYRTTPSPIPHVRGWAAAIEAAAKAAEEDRTPGYGPHKDAMEWLAETQRKSIAERIRALASAEVEG